MIIAKDNSEDPIIGVLASDHLIADVNNFIDSLKISEMKADDGYIVTLGIKPNRPETGYGYIKLSDLTLNKPTKAIKFMEKPNYELALQYLEEGNYVWNSGMFIFRYSTIMKEYMKYLPNHIEVIEAMKKEIGWNSGIKLAQITKPYFSRFEKISIDFAIMEKSQIIYCIPVDFGWNDVGGYNSLEEVFTKDSNGNIVKNAHYVYVDSSDNIVISNKTNRLVTSIGVSNIVIVDTEDALLICNKDDSQRIKELLKKLN